MSFVVDGPPPSSYTDRWLRNAVLPSTPFLVPGRVPYGCWNHAAAPGAYKTTIGWQVAYHIVYGIPLPGLDWKFAEHGSALIVTPDETTWEIQERNFGILPYGRLDTDETEIEPVGKPDIHVFHDPLGLDINERITWLINKINELEERYKQRIVWVQWDTLGNLLGIPQGNNAYDHAAPIRALNHWFATNKRVLFLPNHIGKDGRPIGTVAIDGYCNLNTITEMQCDQQNVGILKVRNKMRGGQHWECALKAKNGLLELDDMSPQAAGHRENTQPRRIADILHRHGPATIDQIGAALQTPPDKLRRTLYRMREAGETQRDDQRRWHLTDTGGKMPEPNPAICLGCGEWVHPVARDGSGYHMSCDPACKEDRWEAADESPTSMEAETSPAQVIDLPPASPIPAWRQMASRTPQAVEPPEIDATYRMDGDQRVWNKSPIGVAVDLIMNARDRGRLTPVWRAPLAPEITDPLDGYHHWGKVPHRRGGLIITEPGGDWISYDVAGSFLASYKTQLAIKALVPYNGDWTPRAAGCVRIRTPEWDHPGLGHPLGAKARPGELQWYWNPAIRLVMKLADDNLIERPEIHALQLRAGYQGASENLLEDFYKKMKAARETFPKGSDELAYIKEMYSAWLSSASTGRYNAFQRPDWTGSIRAEAFSRLWNNAWKAHLAGVAVIGMGNTDEIVFRPHEKLDKLFPQDDGRIGKLKIKDSSHV